MDHRTSSGILARLSRLGSPPAVPTPEALEGFTRAQRLSYECATTVARELQDGWTEKRAAARMDEFLRDHGVKRYFHKPLAWFGDRSRFHRYRSQLYFFPTSRELRAGDVAILDVAPMVDGYVGDIGFTFSKAPRPALAKARDFLMELRRDLPGLFASDLSPAGIWREIDERLKARGYQNVHSKYPFKVLGHRVYRVGWERLPNALFPFTLHTYGTFLQHGVFSELLGPSHEGSKDGLWAIEPHLGADAEEGTTEGFGAKFEEILVVRGKDARWLDEAVPHLALPEGLY